MITLIALVTMTLGYAAGRLHGKAAHHRFLARGFRMMARAAERDRVHTANIYNLAARPIDVSNAFGDQDEEALHKLALIAPIELAE